MFFRDKSRCTARSGGVHSTGHITVLLTVCQRPTSYKLTDKSRIERVARADGVHHMLIQQRRLLTTRPILANHERALASLLDDQGIDIGLHSGDSVFQRLRMRQGAQLFLVRHKHADERQEFLVGEKPLLRRVPLGVERSGNAALSTRAENSGQIAEKTALHEDRRDMQVFRMAQDIMVYIRPTECIHCPLIGDVRAVLCVVEADGCPRSMLRATNEIARIHMFGLQALLHQLAKHILTDHTAERHTRPQRRHIGGKDSRRTAKRQRHLTRKLLFTYLRKAVYLIEYQIYIQLSQGNDIKFFFSHK